LWESDNIFYKRILAFSAILYANNTALTIHDDVKSCNIIVLSNLMGYGGLVAILCQKFWSNICQLCFNFERFECEDLERGDNDSLTTHKY
jgi:hypothetical protein